ncbi:hypothetical protein C5167_000625 [Papaver somniferum]|uniref:Uncharacterized protein n=1 Tax=Papaver somniferum TaxID=3469 RepID=A0A4Y7KS74_PAPSO|nr:hypothetical protein C5167_000625 [Papaver somniferum]
MLLVVNISENEGTKAKVRILAAKGHPWSKIVMPPYISRLKVLTEASPSPAFTSMESIVELDV